MPAGKLRQDYVPLPAASPQPQSQPAAPFDGPATPSPVHTLQDQLERSHTAATTADLKKWSLRRAIAFIVVSSAALWMAVLIAGAQATTQVSQALA